MNPDELRALADAVVYRDSLAIARAADYLRACADTQPVAWMHIDGRVISAATMDQAYRDGGAMQSSLREYTIPLYTHPAPVAPAGWKLVPVEPTEEWLEVGRKAIEDVLIEWRDDRLSELGRGNGCVIRERDGTPSNVIRFGPETALRIGYKAMLAAAPAAPQPEQPIDLDTVAMQQMRQAAAESTWMPSEYTSNDWIADVCRWLRDGPPAAAPQAEPDDDDDVLVLGEPDILTPEDIRRLVPQAEPKREPSCLWSRADDDTDVWETKCGHAFTIIDGTPTDNQMAFCCYCGRRVDEEIGGGDAGTD